MPHGEAARLDFEAVDTLLCSEPHQPAPEATHNAVLLSEPAAGWGVSGRVETGGEEGARGLRSGGKPVPGPERLPRHP